MLAVSPLRSGKNERENQIQDFSSMEGNEFNLLDSIDFDDIFVGIDDGYFLPDLDMDPEILAEKLDENGSGENGEATAASVSGLDTGSGEQIVNEREESVAVNPSPKEDVKGRKSSGHCKNPSGKKKVKVDWTPELHRKFVEAVEQLGVDKAVPSRILEIMGIDCLTRHNIASHLQKYRSHRKHLLAREAEAARWSQRRQMYGMAVVAAGKGEVNPWIAPTMGFPPVTSIPHFSPLLHVWGHPPIDQSLMHTWPKQVAPPPLSWPPFPPAHPLPPADPSFWPHCQYVPTPGTPCFAPHLPPTRFPAPPVHGVPPPAVYKVDSAGQTLPQPPSDVQPSKESIDAAIGDVLAKPWLPLPLGLKPPSLDSVMVELQRQGVSKIPPTNCAK
ncbi:hypothetical protein CDL12_15089 [Handroanthus impetiginosus]|uniref:HTH myb-type domain-containing protein n=1 Tax=Handroanthus impetiginosus TaxID=429701 RepID=A0A2G9H472_9LAMI|nr:hypothetical protein CDL12_15089 [Handroanthus impetiginosus]